MKLLLIGLFAALFATTTFAHEGHDHDGPSSFQPLKGGVVKSTEYINIEVVNKDTKLEIYAFDNEGKVKESASYNLKASMKLPKNKKIEKLTLEPVSDTKTSIFSHYEINSKPKNTHRYTLILEVKDANEHHSDKIEFTIELKK